jgi:hypothetical protein
MLLCSELSVLLMAFESVRVTLGEVETPTREVQSSLPSFRLVLEEAHFLLLSRGEVETCLSSKLQ